MIIRLRAVMAALLILVADPATADAIVTLEFDTGVPATRGFSTFGPYEEDGFRVYSRILPISSPTSPYAYFQGHMDIWCGLQGTCGPIGGIANYDGSHWLGTDSGGSCNYFDADLTLVFTFGGCQGIVRIDRNGDLFSALDFLGVQGAGFTLTSSKGGVLVAGFGGTYSTFEGDLWQGIEWIDFTVPRSVGAPLGFDNLRLVVPEPSIPALLIASLFAVWLSRKVPRISLGAAGRRGSRNRHRWGGGVARESYEWSLRRDGDG